MPMSTYGFSDCSCGSSIPSPTEIAPASRAPRLAASMIPGPPPEMIETVSASSSSSSSEVGWRGSVNTPTVGASGHRPHALVSERATEQQDPEADQRADAVHRVERGQVVEEHLRRRN